MKKVTIEITPKGWTTTVQLGDATHVEKHISTPTGARGTEGNFEDAIEDEDLYSALSGFAQYDIMRALDNYLL